MSHGGRARVHKAQWPSNVHGGEEERMEELSGLRLEMKKIKERLRKEECLSAIE